MISIFLMLAKAMQHHVSEVFGRHGDMSDNRVYTHTGFSFRVFLKGHVEVNEKKYVCMQGCTMKK